MYAIAAILAQNLSSLSPLFLSLSLLPSAPPNFSFLIHCSLSLRSLLSVALPTDLTTHSFVVAYTSISPPLPKPQPPQSFSILQLIQVQYLLCRSSVNLASPFLHRTSFSSSIYIISAVHHESAGLLRRLYILPFSKGQLTWPQNILGACQSAPLPHASPKELSVTLLHRLTGVHICRSLQTSGQILQSPPPCCRVGA